MKNRKQDLIIKFIDGNLSDDEKNELEKFRQTDQDFDLECKEIFNICTATKEMPLPSFDYKPFAGARKTVKLYNRKWFKAASILLIGIFAGIASMHLFFNKNNQYIKVATERGDKIKVELPDGITVWLNSRSEISYNATFSGSNRVIELQGEAFFKVTETTSPFIVKSYNTELICTNGAFNIENDTTLQTTEVEVESGWLALRNPETENKQFIIEEGSKGIVNKFIPIWIEPNTNSNYLAWHTRKMSFSGSTLQDVATTLMEVFDVEISIPDDTKYCTISNNYSNRELNSILDEIQTKLNVEIKQNDHSIIITGNPC